MVIQRQVIVHDTKQALLDGLAARFLSTVGRLQGQQQTVRIVLTGGTVGIGVLAAINASAQRDTIDWSRIDVWWGDERWVPAGHADRNDQQAMDALLSHVALPESSIHPFPASDGGDDLEAAATRYAEELARVAEDGQVPSFDITFLGLGPDGHIASLFPHRGEVARQDSTVVAVRNSPKPPPERLSLSLKAINSSERIWIALAGTDKASPLGLALAGASPDLVPAAGAEGRSRTVFFVDRDAAAEVPRELISAEY